MCTESYCPVLTLTLRDTVRAFAITLYDVNNSALTTLHRTNVLPVETTLSSQQLKALEYMMLMTSVT
jgi:hypothetical protein